jgi:NAD(P)-dependent dehydrogenase (short-subunit alcohol dehydrogenase family)
MTSPVALIIGASRGLGLGLSQELASRGWEVVATTRRAGTLKDSGLIEHVLDVRDAPQLAALRNRLDPGSLDLLFINAGILGPKHQSADLVTDGELVDLMLTNAIAPLRVARQLLPAVKSGGTIAFMSSKMGSVAENHSGDAELYRASKAALNSLTLSFSATLPKERAIKVLTLHPGWVRTDMGGTGATLSIAESTKGLADVIEHNIDGTHRFLDYAGRQISW